MKLILAIIQPEELPDIKDELIKNIPVFSSENVDKVNVFKSLFMSLNYLIWGDV